MENSQKSKLEDPRAVLWDMDGTLIESGEYHWISWREALIAENFQLTRERFNEMFGQRNDTILRAYLGSDISQSDIDRIADVKESLYRKFVKEKGIELLPGVERWLKELQKSGWKQAIASSAPFLNVEAILAALDIESYFDAIVSAEDVQRGKPDPQVFLTAANKLGVAPSRCIVVEDAPAGTEGARRAGMKSIGVLTSHGSLQADIVVHRLTELPADAFDKLIEEI
jgi:beta-phosphoglucomutase family hydrolase